MNYYSSIIIIILIFLLIFVISTIFYNKFFHTKEYFNKQKISVLILSYNRPHNLTKSLPILNENNLIDEIIVSHGNPEHYKEFKYSKVKNIKDYENNDKYGCARRWFNIVENCKNDIVLILDDDQLPSEEYIKKLYNTLIKNYDKNTIYGPHGRNCNKNGGYYYYTGKKTFDTVITGLSMCKKSIVKEYLEKGFKKYKDWIIKNHGNCEDLAFNLFIRQYYNEKPRYIDGEYNEKKIEKLDNKKGYSSNNTHYRVRSDFCKKYN